MKRVPVVSAPIVRAFDGADLIRVKPVGVQMRFGGKQLVELREQCLRAALAQAVEQGADQQLAFVVHDFGPFGFCESMSSSK